MTLKLLLRGIAGDLARLLVPHLRKWSVQIAGIELMAVYPVLFGLAGVIDIYTLLSIAAGFAVLKTVAGVISQKRVKTYDPTTHEVIAKRKREAGDE